eukprot:5143082-Amphidinium_carterae.1
MGHWKSAQQLCVLSAPESKQKNARKVTEKPLKPHKRMINADKVHHAGLAVCCNPKIFDSPLVKVPMKNCDKLLA